MAQLRLKKKVIFFFILAPTCPRYLKRVFQTLFLYFRDTRTTMVGSAKNCKMQDALKKCLKEKCLNRTTLRNWES